MNDKDLVLAAASLARTHSELWSRFVTAFTDYADGKIMECVSAQTDMLPTAQGRAQALVALGRLFEDCVKTAENIDKKR